MHTTSYDREKLFEKITAALERMPDDMREAFILRRYQRLAPEEIAGRLGIAADQLDLLLGQADELLRQTVHPLVAREEDIAGVCAEGSIRIQNPPNWKPLCSSR